MMYNLNESFDSLQFSTLSLSDHQLHKFHYQTFIDQQQQQQQSDTPQSTAKLNIIENLKYIVKILSDDQSTFDDVLSSVRLIRKLLSIDNDPPIDHILATGISPRLIYLLNNSDDNFILQFEISWTLTNLCSGTFEQTQVLVNNNILPVFIRLLSSPQRDIREQSIWALGNIAGTCVFYRDLSLGNGVLEALLPLASRELHHPIYTNNSNNSIINNNSSKSNKSSSIFSWTITNLIRGSPKPSLYHLKLATSILSTIIQEKRESEIPEEEIAQCCWGMSFITQSDSDEHIQLVIDANNLPYLVHLLCHPSTKVQYPAVLTIGNISTGNKEQSLHLSSMPSVIHNLSQLLRSPESSIRRVACWTISNLVEDNLMAITQPSCTIIPLMIDMVENDPSPIVRQEAGWVISNLIESNTDLIEEMVNRGCLNSVYKLIYEPDSKSIQLALNIYKQIFTFLPPDRAEFKQFCKDYQLVTRLRELTSHHPEHEISFLASNIVNKFLTN
ncbi:hypothetical protein CYY_002569 [Polysphondylium violaceum]|uniref:Importin subunit alpha n=1 Tax=Polysphondylium violaceum TaxID=133409 RepID=A0A8J4Q107_9MYCE|nr:hypothetical protein CYY_002569 [Polysphondylium violaceum]